MPYSPTLDVRMTDTCLRDGSHAKSHQFTEQQVRDVVAALDAAGMPVIEVTHGDGLGGSSFNYGFSAVDEIDLGHLMREQFYLALPMKPLCGDDCRGLCPVCGTNLNRGRCQCKREWEDPRLAVLKTLTTDRHKGH